MSIIHNQTVLMRQKKSSAKIYTFTRTYQSFISPVLTESLDRKLFYFITQILFCIAYYSLLYIYYRNQSMLIAGLFLFITDNNTFDYFVILVFMLPP